MRLVIQSRRRLLTGWVPGAVAAFALAACLGLNARGQSQQPATDQKPPVTNGQGSAPAKPATEGNPFPGEENTAPVLPTTNAPVADLSGEAEAMSRNMPAVDTDPARSPEDSESFVEQPTGVDALESSSLSGVHDTDPDDSSASGNAWRGGGAHGGHGKKGAPVAEHQETVKEDLDVGSLYLDQKNWKAALSRFESARVLDPENPDSFFGMAEAELHLGDKVNAKAHYEKVLEYDPDGKHARAAKKALKEIGEGK